MTKIQSTMILKNACSYGDIKEIQNILKEIGARGGAVG
jgi:hypothetical protein